MECGYETLEFMRVHSNIKSELIRPNQKWAFERIIFFMQEKPKAECPVVLIIVLDEVLLDLNEETLTNFPRLEKLYMPNSDLLSCPLNNKIKEIECQKLVSWVNLTNITSLRVREIPTDPPQEDFINLWNFSYFPMLMQDFGDVAFNTINKFTKVMFSDF